MTYRKYDPRVKRMIIASKNANLFPELRIPRTTALYWIQQGDRGTANTEGEKDLHVQNLEKDNYQLRATNLLLMELLKSVNPCADFKSNRDPVIKEKVVNVIESLNGFLSKREFLLSIGLSESAYFRWRSEVLGCEIQKIKCSSGRPSQLKSAEQRTLIDLAKSKKLRQLSVKSLMYYAQRKELLSCGLDTWYKYMKVYKIKRRVNRPKKRKHYLKGLRAEKVNDIWHIDITEFNTLKDGKLYLQVMVDNYSRVILSWKLSDRKGLTLTLKTLKAVDPCTEAPTYLLSDGGRENRNEAVRRVLLGRGITQLIAKSDIHFSNSMIEAVFRQIKQKYIMKRVEDKNELKSLIKNFVHDYNTRNPHSSLQGGTPVEVYRGEWDTLQFKEVVNEKRLNRLKLRSQAYSICKSCLKV
jgi:transposase InsO family protein